MTTVAASTNFSMANTTDLRAMGAELNGWFAAIGLVQTADTGQVDWTTVNMPAANADIGYEVWRFADSSVFFKLEWRTNAATQNPPRFWLTCGTGSDGAGNITSVFFPRSEIQPANTSPQTGSRPSYLCHVTGFLGVVWKHNASNGVPAGLGFAIEKMVDSVGAFTNEGFVVSWFANGKTLVSNKRAVRTAAPAEDYGNTTSHTVVPGNVTSNPIGADREVYMQQYRTPRTRFSNFLCTVLDSELPIATTFQATLLGSTPHTMISVGNGLGTGNSASAALSWSMAMRWE